MKKPVLLGTETLYKHKYLNFYVQDYDNGAHYLVASRHAEDALLSKAETIDETTFPDAVTCVVIVKLPDKKPKLLLQYEFRYPSGQFLLSPPAGLIDAEDCEGLTRDEAIRSAAVREIREETGIVMGKKDRVYTVNPLLFSTPGMTDESNALACAVVHLDDIGLLNTDGMGDTECIDGFTLISRREARRILESGCDEHGIPYSIFTWCALLYFLSGAWE